MKTPLRQLFLGAAIAIFFALTLVALAQEAPPAPAATPEKTTPPPTATAPAAAPAPTEPAKTELRQLDSAAPVAEPASAEKKEATDDQNTQTEKSYTSGHNSSDRVSVMGDVHVLAGEKIEGAAVGVLGDVVIDGEVSRDAVAVMGDNTVNGTVEGNVVAVMGDIHLGPKAKVGGDLICAGGDVHREPGAEVGGRIVKKSVGGKPHFGPGFDTWWMNGLRLGRPLAIGPGLHWQWIFTFFMLGFYALLALVFPGGVRKCGDTLARRPLAVIGVSMLTMLGLPVLFVLLLITIVGIPVALLLLPAGVVLAVLFGKASLYGLVGRAVSNDRLHPALAVLVGAVPCVLLFLVPVAGLMLWLLISMLGLGCVLTALFSNEKKTTPAAPVVPPPAHGAASLAVPPTLPTTAEGTTVSPASGVVAAHVVAPAPVLVPAFSAASQPRAGFWIRIGALAIDGILVCVIFLPMRVGPGIFPLLALYGALMWKMKGTTIGGIVCGLQVVRLDERPLDWPTVVVRALGSFLSLIVAGLGFVWVAFDAEKQSWHDKVAGTTVVCTSKRTSLV